MSELLPLPKGEGAVDVDEVAPKRIPEARGMLPVWLGVIAGVPMPAGVDDPL